MARGAATPTMANDHGGTSIVDRATSGHEGGGGTRSRRERREILLWPQPFRLCRIFSLPPPRGHVFWITPFPGGAHYFDGPLPPIPANHLHRPAVCTNHRAALGSQAGRIVGFVQAGWRMPQSYANSRPGGAINPPRASNKRAWTAAPIDHHHNREILSRKTEDNKIKWIFYPRRQQFDTQDRNMISAKECALPLTRDCISQELKYMRQDIIIW